MDKTKQTIGAAVLAMLVVVAGSWFFLISPQRSQVGSLNSQTQAVAQQNTTLETQITQLKAESVQVSGAQATLAAIARRLPPDPQEANLITDLKHAADAANVDLQIITPLSPIAVAGPVAATVAPAPTTSAGATSTATATAAPARVAAPSTQLYQIPLTLTVAGNYFDVEMFVHSLEGMQRAMVIDQLALASGSTSSGTTGTAAGTSGAPGAPTTSGTTAGTSSTSKSTGGTSKAGTTTSKAGKTGKTGNVAKPVPGSVAGAQAELNSQPQYVVDSNTLTVTITGKVFAMYSPAAAAAAAAAVAPTAAATPAPATTK